MPLFGKYRGCPLHGLPDEYLDWLTSDSINLRSPLREAVWDEVRARQADLEPPPSDPAIAIRIQPDELDMVRQVLEAGYRAKARELHPDVGGSTEDMKRLNALVATWREQLQGLEVAQ